MKNYKKRVIDEILAERLESIGAVLLEGAKWCGKTTTCEQHCRSALYMDDPDKRNQYLRMADSEINNLLEGNSGTQFAIGLIIAKDSDSSFSQARQCFQKRRRKRYSIQAQDVSPG